MTIKSGQLIVLSAVLLFAGCGGEESKGKSVATQNAPNIMKQVAPPRVAPPSQPVQPQQSHPAPRQLQPASPQGETPLMREMGLKIEGSRIILDTQRSKAYFEELGRKLRQSMDQSVKTIKSQSPKGEDLGIYVDQHTVVLDLNKTRKFLEKWVETMEAIGRGLERSLQPPQ